jgi:hypothetical protein
MGLNYADYIKEAYRALKFGGMIKIAEPISRWENKRQGLISALTENSFLLIGELNESNQFMYIDAIKQ